MEWRKNIRFAGFLLIVIGVSGCLSSLQTANTVDKFGFTVGVDTFQHPYLVAMPRAGVEAKANKPGLDIGAKLWADILDPEIMLLFEDVKVQIPKNRFIDVAVDAEFLLYYPFSTSLLISRDIGNLWTVYGEFEAVFLCVLNPFDKDAFHKITIGGRFKPIHHIAFSLETNAVIDEPGLNWAAGIILY
jgi:hypothetical protein